ncbi:aspartyl-phosphate phosphatase Spo0E family protein [Sutcliffiella horikoshii]|uniref:Aspartyl-phosphate phosphatase Spo0E family protein n=1 Tax=Sutcliffiella horikoshii TaxID=79883 RepID=A0A1Y0CKC0_9BACI|nr:aspartyl-phosphate phosphatase Spo0E family protein [Sutcliffiella horikoshii]ART75748.1 Spo0E family sporulation regulatory protein-aspartic acid phosphatase [Sutcliffiella horikoshii]TYS61027.1 aspartyl-phosphate phosphatase Spo0E family protein [Sutcliffiella horikoshii]
MLALKIELKRQQMIHCAKEYGFTASQTVKCSQELDVLLNKQFQQQLRLLESQNKYFYAQ